MTETCIRIGTAALGRLMPLHLGLSPGGQILSAGPTLSKILKPEPLLNRGFFDLFEVRRPGGIVTIAGLTAHAGERLSVVPLGLGAQPLRGIAVVLPQAQGLLVNLSFGIGVIEAVSAQQLTDADFAVTDLAMELLYLFEAKTAVTDELRQLNLRLQGARDVAEEQALTDTLTGLRNRRALDSAMQCAIAQGKSFGLMHIDLDYFKAVNDTLGHAAGDFVLQEVARALIEETRKADTVARVGGDEFVVLFAGLTNPDQLSRIADRLVDRLSTPMQFQGQPCQISASIGVTISTDYDIPMPDRMLEDADQALYASKKAGRGQARLFDVSS